MLIHRLLREDTLCMGEEQQQRGCPDANNVKCSHCAHVWEVEDTNFIPACPSCGERGAAVQRCDHCPVLMLEHVRCTTESGRLLERVLDLDFDCGKFRIGWDEVTADEDQGMKILAQERRKWETERADEQQKEARQQQLIEQIQRRQGR